MSCLSFFSVEDVITVYFVVFCYHFWSTGGFHFYKLAIFFHFCGTLSFMLLFDVIIFIEQMFSFLCHHFYLVYICVIIWVIIWCYHLPFFPQNVTHSSSWRTAIFFQSKVAQKIQGKRYQDGWTTLAMIFFPHLHSTVHTNEGFQVCIRTPEPCTGRVATTKYLYTGSTTVTVPSSELGPHHSLTRKRVCPPSGTKGDGGHTRLQVRGWGGPNSDEGTGEKACLLCGCHQR